MILPDPEADCLKSCDKRTPTQVLAAAVFCTLEKHLFDETTPRADIANLYRITAAQLHKAVTGVDYQSGPHHYKGKRKATDADSTTPTKIQKTDAQSTPATSTSGTQPSGSTPDKEMTPKRGTSHPLTTSLHGMTSHNKIIPMGGTGAMETPSEDTLSSSSSEELPNVPFK